MPIYQVRQVVSHPKFEFRQEKITEISGRDLRHAISCIRCPEPMRKDLAKKYWSETTDPMGRTLYIEIIGDGARSRRGLR